MLPPKMTFCQGLAKIQLILERIHVMKPAARATAVQATSPAMIVTMKQHQSMVHPAVTRTLQSMVVQRVTQMFPSMVGQERRLLNRKNQSTGHLERAQAGKYEFLNKRVFFIFVDQFSFFELIEFF
jgi:hypothetical protein